MNRRYFLRTGAGALGCLAGNCCAAEGEAQILLSFSRPALERRYYHFEFAQAESVERLPSFLAKNTRVYLARLFRARSVKWVSEAEFKLEDLEVLSSSGPEPKVPNFVFAEEMTKRLPRNTMQSRNFKGLSYEACRVGPDASGGIHCTVAFESPVPLPIMLINRSKDADVAYFAERASVLSETRHTVRLSGVVLSCNPDGASITDSVEVTLAGDGLILTYDSKGQIQSLQKADLPELIRIIKDSKGPGKGGSS